MKKLLVALFMCASAFSSELNCVRDGKLVAVSASEEQKDQLYLKGEITDCKGNVFNIVFVPGKETAGEIMDESGAFFIESMKNVVRKETYTNAADSVKSAYKTGQEMVFDGYETMKDGFWEGIAVETWNDFLEGRKVSEEILREGSAINAETGEREYEMGAKVAAFYYKRIEPTLDMYYNIVVGGAEGIWGLLETFVGGVVTTSSFTIVPAYEVLKYPIGGTLVGLLGNTIVPGTVYLWNGTSWYMTKDSLVPTSDSTVFGIPTVEQTKYAETGEEIEAKEVDPITDQATDVIEEIQEELEVEDEVNDETEVEKANIG